MRKVTYNRLLELIEYDRSTVLRYACSLVCVGLPLPRLFDGAHTCLAHALRCNGYRA